MSVQWFRFTFHVQIYEVSNLQTVSSFALVYYFLCFFAFIAFPFETRTRQGWLGRWLGNTNFLLASTIKNKGREHEAGADDADD